MKKALSLVLALTLSLALVAPAFATTETGDLFGVEGYTYTLTDVVSKEKATINGEEMEVFLVTSGSGLGFDAEGGEIGGFCDVYDLVDGSYQRIGFVLFDVEGWPGPTVIRFDKSSAQFEADISGVTPSDNAVYVWSDEIAIRFVAGATEPATTTTAPAETTTTTAPAAEPAGPDSYTTQKYETYGQLAVNYYGSYAYTKALQKANDYKTLKEGVTITLPDKLGNAVRLAPAVAAEGETLYTVKAGDTLGAIAKTVYGNAAQYKAIYERNSDRLKDANTIYEGQVIVLPAK